MNIVIVNDFGHVRGGADRVAIDTAKGLAARGYKVTFFCAVAPIDKELQEKNIEVVCLNQADILTDKNRIRAGIRGLLNLSAAYIFLQTVKKYTANDTVIHIHTLSKAISASIIPIAKILKIKIVYHCHDYGLLCPNLGFYDYQQQSICKAEPLGIKCMGTNCDRRSYLHKLWRVARQMIMNVLGIKKLDAYVYISNFSKNVLQKNGLKNVKMEYLPNFVDTVKKERVKAENNRDYIFVGRLSKEKNPEIFALAASKADVNAVFVGAGACEERIKATNPDASITGWISKEEISKYWQKARALVFSSAWYEGQPLSIIEAKAQGIPVICSDVCAGRDEFIENAEGNLFVADDADSLTRVIYEFKNDELIKRYSEAAYKNYWQKNYTEETYIRRLVLIYEKVLFCGDK